MIRKTLLGFAAAVALSAAALAPTTASAGGANISVHFGGFGGGYGYAPYGYGPYGYGYSDYGYGCSFKEVKVWSKKWQKFIWKTKKVCW